MKYVIRGTLLSALVTFACGGRPEVAPDAELAGTNLVERLAETQRHCPSFEPLSEAQIQEDLAKFVTHHRQLFASEHRDEAWASRKEAALFDRFEPHWANGTIALDAECRTSVCVLRFTHVVAPVPSSQVALRESFELESDFMWGEHCEFSVPSRVTLRELDCGVFEHTTFVRCDR